MRFFLILLNLLYASFLLCKESDYKNLEVKGGLFYETSSSLPFTGKVKGLMKGNIIKGKKEGLFLKYYSSGQLLSKISFKNNLP